MCSQHMDLFNTALFFGFVESTRINSVHLTCISRACMTCCDGYVMVLPGICEVRVQDWNSRLSGCTPAYLPIDLHFIDITLQNELDVTNASM